MRIPGQKSLKLPMRWIRGLLVDSALILVYHRVIDAPWDPYSMCVKPKHFAEHLEVLTKSAYLITLQELVQSVKDDRIRPKSVAITFDDGYADNLHNVRPLLDSYQVPATVFVATGNLGSEFWWDELVRILFTPTKLPERLHFTFKDRNYKWKLDGESDINRRERLLSSLYKLLRSSPEEERRELISELSHWCGNTSENNLSHHALGPDEVMTLANDGLVEVGAHTIRHPLLAEVPPPAQEFEIRKSKSFLEELLGRTVKSFAYPHGSYSDETVAIVRNSGFESASTTLNDIVWRGSNPFKLPRFSVPDYDGEKFSKWLGRWLHS